MGRQPRRGETRDKAMTPEARIEARFAELAEAAGVRVSATTQRINANAWANELFDGRLFHLTVFGELDATQSFSKASRLEFGPELIFWRWRGENRRAYRLQPRHVEKMLVETEMNPTWLHWNEGAVLRIAQGINERAAFDELPVLADALEEAGCDNPHILGHCRAGAPHTGTCWVIELLLPSARNPGAPVQHER
jgi:hypothetical protein